MASTVVRCLKVVANDDVVEIFRSALGDLPRRQLRILSPEWFQKHKRPEVATEEHDSDPSCARLSCD